MEVVAHRYPQITNNFYFTAAASNSLKSIEQALDQVFHELSLKVTDEVMRLRKRVFLLAKAAQTEALARTTGKKYKTHISKDQLNQVASKKTFQDDDLFLRINLGMNRIKRDIIDALELARTMEEPVDAALERVKASFPKAKIIKRPQRVLKEAKKKNEQEEFTGADFSMLFLDEQEWATMVEEYKADFIPRWRDPAFAGEKAEEGEFAGLYDYQAEQQVTQEFVDLVRSGDHEAAKENGITDFVFIATVDDRTDECCKWRDGLTITEIEAKLDEHDDDECEGVVPPLHFNCRCRIEPFTADMPEAPPSSIGDFEAWLLAND